MPIKRGVDLTIQITVGHDQSTVTLSRPGADRRPFLSPLRRSSLDELAKGMRNDLDQFARLATVSPDLPERLQWARRNEAMKTLRRVGGKVGSSLFKDDDVHAVQQFCREACRWNQKSREDPKVDLVVDPVAIAPLEFVPFFRRKSAGTVRDGASLDAEAQSYLGYAAVVRRKLRAEGDDQSDKPEKTINLLRGNPELRARIFQYSGLKAVTAGTQALSRPGVALSSLVPDRDLTTEQLENTVGRLFRTANDQIFYFGCHCNTVGSDTLRHNFVLSHNGERFEKAVEVSAIRNYFYQNGPRKNAGPLIFMNACGGAAVIPSGLASLPELFLTRNFRGYIGAEAIVPDGPAGAFAKEFFRRFLGGEDLGSALLGSRRRLLGRGNPIGILYTAYAAPDLIATIGK